MDAGVIRREECHREVDEMEAAAEKWHFWSDGHDLLPYCPECSGHEFGREETKSVPLVHPRAATNGS